MSDKQIEKSREYTEDTATEECKELQMQQVFSPNPKSNIRMLTAEKTSNEFFMFWGKLFANHLWFASLWFKK